MDEAAAATPRLTWWRLREGPIPMGVVVVVARVAADSAAIARLTTKTESSEAGISAEKMLMCVGARMRLGW